MSPEAWIGLVGGSVTVGGVIGLLLKGIFVTKTDCAAARATCQEAEKKRSEAIDNRFDGVEDELAEIKRFIVLIMDRLKIRNDEITRFEK